MKRKIHPKRRLSNVSDGTSPLDRLGRRGYLQATGVAALGTVGLAGCVGRATGTLATHVTDQPADIGDFESLLVTIEGVWLGPEGALSGAEDGDDDEEMDNDEEAGDTDEEDGDETDDETEPAGREYHEFDEPETADLVQLQGEETQLIDERELSVTSYQFLQLNVSDVDGTLEDGAKRPLICLGTRRSRSTRSSKFERTLGQASRPTSRRSAAVPVRTFSDRSRKASRSSTTRRRATEPTALTRTRIGAVRTIGRRHVPPSPPLESRSIDRVGSVVI